jgi:hypothetical protein
MPAGPYPPPGPGSYPPGPDFEIPPKTPKPSMSESFVTFIMSEITLPVWVFAVFAFATGFIFTGIGIAIGRSSTPAVLYGGATASPWTPEPDYPPRPYPPRPYPPTPPRFDTEYVLVGEARKTQHGIEVKGNLYPKDGRGGYFKPADEPTLRSEPSPDGDETPETVIPPRNP